MNPRLKTSKKWTSFPAEYSDQIRTVFSENFSEFLKNADLIIEGRIYSEEILLRVGVKQKNQISQANFEVSANYSNQDQDAVTSIHNCIDVAASMMMEYFEKDGEVDFPYLWKEYPFQGKKVFLQFTTENSSLEAEANRLLGADEDSLYHEDSDNDDDALSRAEQDEELSPPRDDEGYTEEDEEADDDGDKGPRMFGGGKKKSKTHLH